MSDELTNLQITTWYKAIVAVSAAAFLITLATQRDDLTMIFGGTFLIGVGEWKNHPKMTFELRPTRPSFPKFESYQAALSSLKDQV
jgi:hypothetical protein